MYKTETNSVLTHSNIFPYEIFVLTNYYTLLAITLKIIPLSYLPTRQHGLELASEKKSVTSHKQTNKQTKPLVKEKPGQMDKSPILWKDLKLSAPTRLLHIFNPCKPAN